MNDIVKIERKRGFKKSKQQMEKDKEIQQML
jgi:hypothetical protein